MPMTRFKACSGGALVAVCLAAALADAAPPKLDPKIARALATGLIGPSGRAAPLGRAGVLVELDKPADAVALERLQPTGAELTFVKGQALAYDRFVPVDVDAHAAS